MSENKTCYSYLSFHINTQTEDDIQETKFNEPVVKWKAIKRTELLKNYSWNSVWNLIATFQKH
jgi:hypothetical protein